MNDEVTKSVLHFECLLGDLLMKWYDTEKSFQQAIREEKEEFVLSVEESIEKILSSHKDNSGKMTEFYQNMETSLVSEFFEPILPVSNSLNSRNSNLLALSTNVTTEQHDPILNSMRTGNDSPNKPSALISRSLSNASGGGNGADSPTKAQQRMARRSSREPLTITRQNSVNTLRGGGSNSPIIRISSRETPPSDPSSLRHSPSQEHHPYAPSINPTSSSVNLLLSLPHSYHPSWIKLRDKFHLYVTTIAKQFKTSRLNMINLIKSNRRKRNSSIDLLERKAQEIRFAWETIRSDLLQKMNRYVMEAREHHSILSVELLDLIKQYRTIESQRLDNFRTTITAEIHATFQSTLITCDSRDREIFDEYDDRVEDVLVATNKEINEIDHQPIPLRSFLREIETTPINFLDAMRSLSFQFYEKYPFHVDDGDTTIETDQLIYQFHQTSEVLSMCLDYLRKVCQGIMDDYVKDKRETYKRLRGISKCEEMLECRPQVSSVLDMMVNTIEAEEAIKHELNDQSKTVTTRNRSLDQTIQKFLSSNTLPGRPHSTSLVADPPVSP